MRLEKNIMPGELWVEKRSTGARGPAKVISVEGDGYVIARHPHTKPFVMTETEFRKAYEEEEIVF